MVDDKKMFPVEPMPELDAESQEISDEIVEGLNNNSNKIDWNHWLSLALWKPVEAVYLLNLYSPINQVEHKKALAYFGVNSGFGGAMQKINNQIVLAERDVRAGILPENVSPSRWVQWAESKNIKIPSQLLSHDAIGVIKVKDSRKKWEIEGTLEYHCRKLGNKYIATMEYMPSVVDIAKYVEQRLKDENKTGRRGDYWDWQTIKKEALTGLTGRKAKGKK